MKYEESIVEKFLKTISHEVITYEPNGNRTPDFALGQNIGVEVRRLSKTITLFGKSSVPEKLQFKLIPEIEKLFSSIELKINENGYFAMISFERPLSPNKVFIKRLSEALSNLKDKNTIISQKLVLENLEISFFESCELLESRFVLGMFSNRNLGGFVLSNISESLTKIIIEKEKKIQPFFNQYESWWLVLIDQIGKGLNKNEACQIENTALKNSKFEKVFIVSPLPPHIGYDVKNYS
jgi:hypothetical protein